MIQSKFKKMLFSLMLIFVMVFALGQNFIYAVKNGPITVLSSPERYIENGGVFTATKEYNIGMDTHIYQISSVNGTTRTAINFYCLNGELTPWHFKYVTPCCKNINFLSVKLFLSIALLDLIMFT